MADQPRFFAREYREFQPMGIGLLPRKLTAREAENRRAYESHVLQTTIANDVPVCDWHTRKTYLPLRGRRAYDKWKLSR